MKSGRIIKSIFSVTGVLIFAKLMGFVKQMVTASAFGATQDTDLINLSQDLIANIEYILVHTISTAFVAVYIKTCQKDKESGNKLVSDFVKINASLITVLVLLIIFFSPLLTHIIAPSYTNELSERLAQYIRIYAPALLLITLASVFNGVLNSNQKFVPGQLSGLLMSVITIVIVWTLNDVLGVNSLVVAFLTYVVINFCFLLFMSLRFWRFSTSNPLKNKDLLSLFKMMGPLFVGYAMIFINQQVDKIIVSGMSAGTVTSMIYAATLSNLVVTLLGAAISVLYTHMTVETSKGDHEKSANIALYASVFLITLLLPVTIITIGSAKDIVQIIYGRGRFDNQAVLSASLALMGYGLMFVPSALKSIYGSYQYGRQDSKRPMINSSICIAINILLSILLSKIWGVFGVTIATSFSVCINALLNMLTAKRHSECIRFKEFVTLLPSWVIGSVLCIGVIIITNLFLSELAPLLRFFISVTAGFVFYCIGLVPWISKYKQYIRIFKKK